MRKVSKYLFIIISALLLTTSIPVNTFAVQGDLKPPVVTSLTLDKHTVYPGDIVTITCKATDDSEISLDPDSDYKTFLYLKNGTNYSDLFYFTKKSNGVYTAQLEIPDTYVNGFYFFSYFVITDVEGNEYSSYSSSTYRDIYFEVKGAANDTKAPTVKSISIDKNSVSPGDQVTVTCEITDENDLDTDPYSSYLYLKNDNYISDHFAFEKVERGIYSATITIDQYYVNGSYQFAELSLTDMVGNQYYTADSSKYPDLYFKVTNASDDRDAPVIEEISIDKHDVSEGDTVTITSVINDESAIACDSLNHYLILRNGTFYSDLFVFNKTADNTYSASLPITKDYVDGKYSVNYYIVSDLIGNKQISYSAADYPEIYITVSGNPANEYYHKPGWFMADEKWYFNNASGELQHGWLLLKNKWRYMDLTTGEMRTGWLSYKGAWYYLDPNDDGIMATGWRYDSGSWYYMNADGIRQSGWIKLNNKWRYLDPKNDDAMYKGWMTDNKGYTYYLDPKNDGVMVTGWKYIENQWYYFSSGGILLKGWLQLNGKWRYMDPETGAMKKGWMTDDKGFTYYLDPENDGVMVTGWNYIENQWYYFSSGGIMLKDWIKINSSWYYLDPADGHLWTGLQTIKGDQFLFADAPSGKMLTGWQKIESEWYYFHPTSGKMQKGWIKPNNYWYYLDPSDGHLWTGLQTINGEKYLLADAPSGKMLTGWQKIDGDWYYFHPTSGKMQKGWIHPNSYWYYLDPETGIMKTGWLDYNDNWYFLQESSGRMATETCVVGGYQQVFHTNGIWISTKPMDAKAANYTSNTNYLILVSLSDKVTKIYKKNGSSWAVEKAYLCTVGDSSKGWNTVKGTFYIGQSSWGNPTWKGYSFQDEDGHTLYYWTRFCDSFLFHSLLYDGGTWNETTSGNGLGQELSHGCVRMRWQNAKWIYDNVPYGTKVVVY